MNIVRLGEKIRFTLLHMDGEPTFRRDFRSVRRSGLACDEWGHFL